MKPGLRRVAAYLLCAALLHVESAQAAKDHVEVHAFVNDACIVADEPFFLPAPAGEDAGQANAKFLPLIGLVFGKLAELFIGHEIQSAADRLKAKNARKDTSYAVVKSMNLYRADVEPAPTLGINAKVGCMTIVAATLAPAGTDCRARYVPKELDHATLTKPQSEWRTTRSDDSVENQLRRANICVEGSARAVYETRFEFSKDGTNYRLNDAGYRIESLLTTQDPKSTRSVMVTLKISQAGIGDQQEALTTAWVKLGTLSAGAHSAGGDGEVSPWLRVPAMTTDARRDYETKTKIYQDEAAEIEALKRALVRNQRQLASLDQRIAGANPEIVAGLREQRTRIAVQNETQAAELDARNAEYADLPQASFEFMPVTIEVGVTESESEKKTQLALADIIGKESDVVASAVGNSTSDLLSKAVSAEDLAIDPAGDRGDQTDPGDHADRAGAPPPTLELARAQYFDALVAVRTGTDDGSREDQERRLMTAKAVYNETRRALGLELIE
jgi:hypothetical protein